MAKPSNVTNIKTAAPTAAPKKAPGKAVSFVASSAMSANVGVQALRAFRAWDDAEAQIALLNDQLAPKRYETLGLLTAAFLKAAANDPAINLKDCQEKPRSPTETALRRRLEVAVGIRIVDRK